MDCKPTRLLCPWDSPGHSLLQGIFPTPGMEPGSPALQADSLPTEPLDGVCVCVCVCVRARVRAFLVPQFYQVKTRCIHVNNFNFF